MGHWEINSPTEHGEWSDEHKLLPEFEMCHNTLSFRLIAIAMGSKHNRSISTVDYRRDFLNVPNLPNKHEEGIAGATVEYLA